MTSITLASSGVPTNWRYVPLGALGTWRGGGTPSKSKSEYWTNGTVPWVSPKDMKQPRIRSAVDRITESAVAGSATNLVPEGSVLVVTRSGILMHTLPVAVTDLPVAINQDLKALAVRGDVKPSYVAWALRRFEGDILRTCTKAGTTVASVEFSKFLEFSIPVAPEDDQGRIVAAIEEQFSRVDAGRRAIQAGAKRLLQMRKKILERFLDDAGPLVELKTASSIQLGRQRSPKNHSGEHMRPYIRAANVDWDGLRLDDVKRMNFSPQEFRTFALEPGDVLLNEASGSAHEVGKAVVWRGEIDNCCFQNTVLRVRTNREMLRPEFLRYVFLRDGLTRRFALASRGVGIHHLGAGMLSRWQVPLPEIGQQDRIVAALDAITSDLTAAKGMLHAAEVRAGRLREAILREAFAGRLTSSGKSR